MRGNDNIECKAAQSEANLQKCDVSVVQGYLERYIVKNSKNVSMTRHGVNFLQAISSTVNVSAKVAKCNTTRRHFSRMPTACLRIDVQDT